MPNTFVSFSIAALLVLKRSASLVSIVIASERMATNGVALAALSPAVMFFNGFMTFVTPFPKKPIFPAASAVCIA